MIIAIRGDTSTTLLQRGTDRRALLQYMLEVGGRCTIAEAEAFFGQNLSRLIENLIISGWLEYCETELPRRPKSLKRRIDLSGESIDSLE